MKPWLVVLVFLLITGISLGLTQSHSGPQSLTQLHSNRKSLTQLNSSEQSLSNSGKWRIRMGGICKNIAPNIPQLEKILHQLLKNHANLDIFLFENNSDDSTQELLLSTFKNVSRVHVQSKTLSDEEMRNISKFRTWEDKVCRMEMISWARNQLLDFMFPHGIQNTDYVVIFDPDVKHLDVPQFTSVINNLHRSEWDAVFANGQVGESNQYYDYYALRDEQVPFGPECYEQGFFETIEKYRFALVSSGEEQYKRVYSAFGGLGIYRSDCFRGIFPRYNASPTDNLIALYENIKTAHPEKVQEFKIQNAADESIKFFNNCGYDGPVVCEHLPFHATIRIQNQKTNFVIDSKLIYKQ